MSGSGQNASSNAFRRIPLRHVPLRSLPGPLRYKNTAPAARFVWPALQSLGARDVAHLARRFWLGKSLLDCLVKKSPSLSRLQRRGRRIAAEFLFGFPPLPEVVRPCQHSIEGHDPEEHKCRVRVLDAYVQVRIDDGVTFMASK